MIFHLGTDIPAKVPTHLDETVPDLTPRESDILREQIRKNSKLIDDYVSRLDLLVNKEKYPQKAAFIERIRRRLELLMEENNTFRKVIWKHYQQLNYPD